MGNPSDTITEIAAKPIPKQYRKTALVTAVQFKKLGDHDAVKEAPESPTGFGIYTLENTACKYEVTPGDFILGPGPKGEFYACKPDVFAATYEEVK